MVTKQKTTILKKNCNVTLKNCLTTTTTTMFLHPNSHLYVNYQRNIFKVLLAHLENMFGQTTLENKPMINPPYMLDVTCIIYHYMFWYLFIRKGRYKDHPKHHTTEGVFVIRKNNNEKISSLPCNLFLASWYCVFRTFSTWSGRALWIKCTIAEHLTWSSWEGSEDTVSWCQK